jgi:hypothetical protein
MARYGLGENEQRLATTSTVRAVSCGWGHSSDLQAGPSYLRVSDLANDLPELQLTKAVPQIPDP